MHIRLYTLDQIDLLRNINHMLGKRQIPKELLKYAESVLRQENKDEQVFVVIMLQPLVDDFIEIKDELGLYPGEAVSPNDLVFMEIQAEDIPFCKKREWYCVLIVWNGMHIHVIYSVRQKHLRRE